MPIPYLIFIVIFVENLRDPNKYEISSIESYVAVQTNGIRKTVNVYLLFSTEPKHVTAIKMLSDT